MIKKILIVDDSPIARKMLKSVLPKGTEFKIEEAVDGEDGINKYAAFKPDITFLDLTMPMKDGFQAIAEIKDADPQAMMDHMYRTMRVFVQQWVDVREELTEELARRQQEDGSWPIRTTAGWKAIPTCRPPSPCRR